MTTILFEVVAVVSTYLKLSSSCPNFRFLYFSIALKSNCKYLSMDLDDRRSMYGIKIEMAADAFSKIQEKCTAIWEIEQSSEKEN